VADWLDDFNGSSLDARWGSSLTPSGGTLTFPLSAGGSFLGSNGPSNRIDLTGRALRLQISAYPDTTGNTGYAYLSCYVDGSNYVSFTVTETGITAYHNIAGGGNTQVASLGGVSPAHIRIREKDGTIYWEYGSDGSHWTQLYSEAAAFAVTALNLEIAAFKDVSDTTVTNFALTQAAYTTLTVPDNDDFANAEVISGEYGSLAGTNDGATLEAGEATDLSYGTDYGSTVWYEWVCPSSGLYTFRAEGHAPTVDIIISAVQGTGFGDFSVVSQLDSGFGDQITFTADVGETYYITVGGYIGNAPDDEGAWSLMWKKEYQNPTTLAFDAATESIRSSTADPYNFTHTPVGTPRAVVVTIVQNASTVTYVTGVTYGGVAMKRATVNDQTNIGTSEFGAVQIWFLGENIPTGAQTVSVDLNANTDNDQQIVCMTFTGSADCIVGGGSSWFATSAGTNLSLAQAKRTNYGITLMAAFSGQDSPASITDTAASTRVADHDFGTRSAVVWRETTASVLDNVVGGTQSSDDVAAIGIFIMEKKPAADLVASDLVDTFSGADLDTDWQTANTDASVGLASGKAQLVLEASSAGFAELAKFFRYDLRDDSICWKPDVASLGNDTNMNWIVQLDDLAANRATVVIEKTGGVYTVYSSIYLHGNRTGFNVNEAYSTTAHKWLRFREASGTIYVEKSSDGIDWTAIQSRAVPVRWDNITFYADLLTFGSNASTAGFDNLNYPPLGKVSTGITFGSSVAGRYSHFGSTTTPIVIGISTQGQTAVGTHIEMDIVVGGSVVGRSHRHGSASLSILAGIRTSGGGVVQGDSSLGIVFGSSIDGTVRPRQFGSARASFVLGAVVAGIVRPKHYGSADATFTFGAVAQGTSLRRGQVSFPITARISTYVDPDYPTLTPLADGTLQLTPASEDTVLFAPLADSTLQLEVAPEHADLLLEVLDTDTLTLTVLPDQAP